VCGGHGTDESMVIATGQECNECGKGERFSDCWSFPLVVYRAERRILTSEIVRARSREVRSLGVVAAECSLDESRIFPIMADRQGFGGCYAAIES